MTLYKIVSLGTKCSPVPSIEGEKNKGNTRDPESGSSGQRKASDGFSFGCKGDLNVGLSSWEHNRD